MRSLRDEVSLRARRRRDAAAAPARAADASSLPRRTRWRRAASPRRRVAAAVPEPLRVLKGTIGRNATLAHVLRERSPPAASTRWSRPRGRSTTWRALRGPALRRDLRPRRPARRLHLRHRRAAHAAGDPQRRRPRGGGASPASTRRGRRARTGVITSSLFGAVSDAGEEDQLALDLAEIFAWDVDFNTELQKGDSFRVAVEKLYLDGRFGRYGRILAAELVRGAARGARACASTAGTAPGTTRPRARRCARRSCARPLKFSRISSRLHPRALPPHPQDACGRTSAWTTRRPRARRCARPPTAWSRWPAGRAATARR